jgi:hypothetical protein
MSRTVRTLLVALLVVGGDARDRSRSGRCDGWIDSDDDSV